MTEKDLLKQGERIDDLHRNNYKIVQNPNHFCFGMDAVLLSGFAHVESEEQVLDLGTGTGIIPILLEAKSNGARFTGIEIQKESVDMARRSICLNGLENKIKIVEGDIKECLNIFAPSSFDVVTSNPPYIKNGKGLTNENEKVAIARHEILCSLEDVVRAAGKTVKVFGRFYMIHRPQRLLDSMELFRKYDLEPKRIRFVFPFIDKPPNMVMIEGVRQGKPQLTIEPPLIVYQKPGIYTDEIYDIYGIKKE